VKKLSRSRDYVNGVPSEVVERFIRTRVAYCPICDRFVPIIPEDHFKVYHPDAVKKR